MAWTKDQMRAIELTGKNILVSAAAGSGKTAVLTERVVTHLLQSEQGTENWNVDELLIVTFTKAAAAEMSDRIGQRLQQAIAAELEKEQPDKSLIARLEKQIILLSSASISTIDSFCQKIVKNNFSVLDLDPQFRVANENELLLMQQDVLDELFEAKYNAGDAALERLGERYASDRGDAALYDLVLSIYEKAMNQPFPEAWLEKLAEDFSLPGNTAPHLRDYAKWWQPIMDVLFSGLERAKDEFAVFSQLLEEIDDAKARSKYDAIGERIQFLLNRIAVALSGEWQDIYDAFKDLDNKETGFIRLPGGKMNIDSGLREQLKNANTAVKDVLQNLKKQIVIDPEQLMVQDLQELAQDARGIADLVRDFLHSYAAAKREKNVIDYSDMEHFALTVLLAEGAGAGDLRPSEAALALRRKYKEIMVDEYQDTNEVQDTIVRLIAGENGGNLFTVGDVKQSIYGFRSSEPGLFIDKYERYGEDMTQGESCNELVTLGQNFRSRREILSGVNFVFAQLMQKKPMDIDYDEKAMLNPGESYAYHEPEQGEVMPLSAAMELDIIMESGLETEAAAENAAEDGAENEEDELKSFQLEAQLIADKLKALKNSGYLVFDKHQQDNNGYRPIRWRDMVILLRAVKGKAEILQEIFQANDIPVFASLEGGYFQATEIQVITSLLGVIDNAQQDIPLAAVLYSPIGGFSPEQLAKLRLSGEGKNLYQLLLSAGSAEVQLSPQIKHKTAAFLQRLSQWRRLAQRLGVAELLWHIYQDTGYYDYAGCMPGGLLRQANLRMLITRAREYEESNYRGLFRFLNYLAKIQKMDTDLSMARTLGENEDVVRVMSVHKSKGLEFPVVVLADMAKGFNLQDVSQDVILHKDLGLGLNNIDTVKSVKYPSFARIAVKNKIIQENKAEELRVLYVAMTRAIEKLIMTGRVKNGVKSAEKWCRYHERDSSTLLPGYAVSDGSCYLDWVAMAAARHPGTGDFAPLLGQTPEEYVQALGYMHSAMGSESRWQINLVSASDIKAGNKAEAEEAKLLTAIIKGEKLPVSQKAEAEAAAILDWHYDFRATEALPAKLSVSELKRRFAREQLQAEPPEVSVADGSIREDMEYTYSKPVFLQRLAEERRPKISGAEYGTLMHSVLQHLQLGSAMSRENISSQLDMMVQQEIITREQRKAVSLKQLTGFFASSIGQRMLSARQVWRELPFSRMLPAQAFFPEVQDGNTEIFNQGVIDVLFQEADGGLILLDYKTDWDTETKSVKEKYAIQLSLYAHAIKTIFGQEPTEKYLYMLRDGSVIQG